MNTKIVIIIIVIVLGFVFFIARDGSDEVLLEDSTGEAGVESAVPAPGSEGVDEMIVVEDEDAMEDDSLGTESSGRTSAEPGAKGADSTEGTGSTPAVVTYTASGFSPTTVTISKGESVTWKNESNRRMWVASAVHPTHTIYPEQTDVDCLGSSFDACAGAGVGVSYEFTFNEVGTWKYHNHLGISNTGTVIVE
ncbi:hypothetical protein IID26_02835 [Patescibacteria group bacterium]|nr:hypothetical protein [Patescibacteria group bacterium]